MCWGITGGCSFRGDAKKVKTLFNPISFSSLFVQNVLRCHPARPEASVVHQQLSAHADRASLSICRVIASNQGLQQTNPDRYSHLGFTLGQLWCHPNGGTERGKQQSVMYAECLHVLDHSNTSACHRRHQFYLVTALRGNPYDCSAVWTLLIVIYLSGVIMLSRGWQRNIMEEVPNEGRKPGLWSIFCATSWPFTTYESSSNLLSHPTPVSLVPDPQFMWEA